MSEEHFVVRVRGLPWETTESEVAEFFCNSDIKGSYRAPLSPSHYLFRFSFQIGTYRVEVITVNYPNQGTNSQQKCQGKG